MLNLRSDWYQLKNNMIPQSNRRPDIFTNKLTLAPKSYTPGDGVAGTVLKHAPYCFTCPQHNVSRYILCLRYCLSTRFVPYQHWFTRDSIPLPRYTCPLFSLPSRYHYVTDTSGYCRLGQGRQKGCLHFLSLPCWKDNLHRFRIRIWLESGLRFGTRSRFETGSVSAFGTRSGSESGFGSEFESWSRSKFGTGSECGSSYMNHY